MQRKKYFSETYYIVVSHETFS